MQSNEKQTHLRFFGIGKIYLFIRPYGKVLIVMAFWGLVTSLIDVGITLFQRYAVNHFVELKTLDTLPWFIIAYIAAICMSSLSTFISCTRAMAVEVRINRDLRSAAFTHLQTLSFSYFNQNSVGYIHARVLSDTSRIGSLASWSFMDAVWHSSYLIFASVVMLVINAKLALMVLAIMPLVVILFSFFQNKLIKANREIREINSTITSNFNEGITGAKTVKTLAIEKGMQRRFEGDTNRMKARSVLAARLRGLFACTMTFASSLALAVVLWRHELIAADEVGTFSMFMSYAQGLMEPIRWLIDSISDLISTQVNIERFTNLLKVKSDVLDSPDVIDKYGDSFVPNKQNWEELKGDIEFKDVSFTYPDGDEEVLSHFSLKIPFGSNIAIVGETGAGKSTLVNLVCRFYEPSDGQVLIDGRDAR